MGHSCTGDNVGGQVGLMAEEAELAEEAEEVVIHTH